MGEKKAWQTEHPFRDIADDVLRYLLGKKLAVNELYFVLEKVKRTIESSVQTSVFGESFTCMHALDNEPLNMVAAYLHRHGFFDSVSDIRTPALSENSEPNDPEAIDAKKQNPASGQSTLSLCECHQDSTKARSNQNEPACVCEVWRPRPKTHLQACLEEIQADVREKYGDVVADALLKEPPQSS